MRNERLASTDRSSITAATRHIFAYLSRMAQQAYADPVLTVNLVLTKNPFYGALLERYVLGHPARSYGIAFKALKIARYLAKNIVLFLLHAACRIACRPPLAPMPASASRTVLVDIFFLVGDTLSNGRFTDKYFPGLAGHLTSHNVTWTYVPKFYGLKTPRQLTALLRVLERQNVPAVTEFHLLTAGDYAGILYDILRYPFRLARFARTTGSTREDSLLRQAFWESLDQNVLNGFVRERFGRRLAERYPDIHCISWYENQELDKMFYRGLRSRHAAVSIHGAQLFLWPETMLNYTFDPAEVRFGTTPDRIIVNGSAYLREEGTFAVGPSLRYSWIFSTPPVRDSKGKVLVILPYFHTEILRILQVLQNAPHDFIFKFHPATDSGRYRHLLTERHTVTDKRLQDVLSECRIVAGSSSGALLESAALGFPVVVLHNPDALNHFYLPEYGKDVIWHLAESAAEIQEAIVRLDERLAQHPHSLDEVSLTYRNMFFTPPPGHPEGVSIDRAFSLPHSEQNEPPASATPFGNA